MISLGLLETNSIARGVIAGDAMLKAAEVTLLRAGAICPGKYTVVIYGEVAAVAASMDAGKNYAGEFLIDDLIIASLDPQVVQAITGGNPPAAFVRRNKGTSAAASGPISSGVPQRNPACISSLRFTAVKYNLFFRKCPLDNAKSKE